MEQDRKLQLMESLVETLCAERSAEPPRTRNAGNL